MLTGLPRTLRVHALTGRITLDTLHKALKAVKRNRGAAGLDKQSIKMFEANVEENLLALMRDRKSGTSQPIPLRRVSIPKSPGIFRPVGIPSVRCRVAQEVIRALLEPIVAPTFHDRSQGFRRRRSCHTAMAQLVEWHQQGYRVVVEADLQGFFDSIPHQLILDLVAGESADGNILNLITKCLQAGGREEGEGRPTWKGTPQGGVISPLLATLALNQLDGRLEARGDKFVRYADAVRHITRCQIPFTERRGSEEKTSGSTTYLDAKAEGNKSMSLKRKRPEGVYDLVPQDPRDRVRATLPKSPFPAMQAYIPCPQRLLAGSP